MKYLMSAALLALVLMAGCSTAVVPEPSVGAGRAAAASHAAAAGGGGLPAAR